MCPNDADGMANSVDPDQTAPRSSLIWVCTVYPDISVRKLRIITVACFSIFQLFVETYPIFMPNRLFCYTNFLIAYEIYE